MNNIDKYLKICDWAKARYTKNGSLILSTGFNPSPFTRIENAAWAKYLAETTTIWNKKYVFLR